jgi:lipoprotein-anchoring transpeptidase ErfK/SrfK
MVLSSNDIKTTTAKAGTPTQIFRFATTNVLEPACYVIGAATGLALDVTGGSSASGANVQLYAKNNTGAQKWNLSYSSDGYYTITNAASGKALDVTGNSSKDATNVQQANPSKTDAQKWKIVPTGDGWFYLQAKNGTYLTGANNGDKNGDNVFISTSYTASKAQKFEFIKTTYAEYFGTYADVNLTTQHMFFVKDGVKVLECDIVSGAPYMATPTGTFRLYGKTSPAVLVGADYRTPVTYWMPFNGGVGFHDANWQPWFGGNRYLNNGSHGCINMPFDKAKELYSYISIGDTVKVHR